MKNNSYKNFIMFSEDFLPTMCSSHSCGLASHLHCFYKGLSVQAREVEWQSCSFAPGFWDVPQAFCGTGTMISERSVDFWDYHNMELIRNIT